MDKEECLKDLNELMEVVETYIEKACDKKKYENSAVFRDVKKDLLQTIETIKTK